MQFRAKMVYKENWFVLSLLKMFNLTPINNAVLEHSTKMEQMQQELEGLQTQNAKLKKNSAPPPLQE